MKQNRKISLRMLAIILPTVTVGLAILMLVSFISSRDLLMNQIKEKMSLNLNHELTEIETRIRRVSDLAKNISYTVGNTYTSTKLEQYESLFAEYITTESIVLGSGIWFEPYIYDSAEKYVGPYIYKEGEKAVTTYAYSNAEYDYFSYEFYSNGEGSSGEPVLTEPYYDPELDKIMSSCSAPIFNPAGKFIGVVTVDIELSSIQDVVKTIQVGETGLAFLINSDGQFLYQQSSDNILDQSIASDANVSYAQAGTLMLKEKEGQTSYLNENKKMNLYYKTLDSMGWTLAISIEDAELTEPSFELLRKMITVAAIILIVVLSCILLEVSAISRQINKVKEFAVQLAAGNFTVNKLDVKRRDELGAMGTSLNEMYQSNKNIIGKITVNAKELNSFSINLNDSAKRLSTQYKMIEELLNEVNMDMTSNCAATQQVNASIEEVNAAVMLLSDKSDSSTSLAEEIKKRASEIRMSSERSSIQAQELSTNHKENLNMCFQKADVVTRIGDMTEVIAKIAKQINFLSLNASIEAARAGEQGKGFSVVADRIGKLASETSTAVTQIKDMISEVQSAFQELLEQSRSMLGFVTDTVTPDYEKFVNVSKQYGEDAVTIEDFSLATSMMVVEIEKIISEVTKAVQNIAESSQNTVDNSNAIVDSVNAVSVEVVQISDTSVAQSTVAGDLHSVISNFTLDDEPK